MPANKNAMTRYMILDRLLHNRYHNYSLDDLTEQVSRRLAELYPDTRGVVRRTIEKDIYYLEVEGPFLAEIERYAVEATHPQTLKPYRKQCLRYADPSFSIFKQPLTDDERYLLGEALSLLGQFDGLPELGGLDELKRSLGIKPTQRRIISLTKNPLEGSNVLGELFTAISHRVVVEVRYHKFNSDAPAGVVNVHPYLLKEYNRRWYLIAAAETDLKMLTFGLDRIDQVTALPSHPFVDHDGDINERFEDIIGVTYIDDAPVLGIDLWVSDRQKDYVATKPLHESQKPLRGQREDKLRQLYPTLSGGAFFHLDCRENYELLRELTSHGADLLVLSPPRLRQQIAARLNAMQAAYEQTSPQTRSIL